METEKPSSKVGYHHGHLREALLQAGLEALKTQSPAELSLRALAKSVGVSANALYRHFADKDAWLDAMAAEGFRRFAQTQRAAVTQDTDASMRLMAAGRDYIHFAMNEPALFKLMFERITRQNCDGDMLAASMDALSVLLDCTADLVQAPVHDERTRVMAAAAWGMVHGLSELAMGRQLMVLGPDVQGLIDKVMSIDAMSGMLRR